jgi:isopropylmalate/homocitrate/citramalate synthase
MPLEIPSVPAESTANVLTAGREPAIGHAVELYDNTLREGEQPPGVHFTPDEKLAIAHALDQLGVPWANVGFPAVSEEEQRAVREIATSGLRMKTAVLCRMMHRDIEVSVESGVDLISLFVGSSDLHLAQKHHLTEAQVLGKIEELVPHAKSSGKLVAFSLEDGSRTPLDRIVRMFRLAQDAGADFVVLADTVGILTPFATYELFRVLRDEIQVPIAVHFHDDLGLALANTLSALQAGARMAHVTVNGVGERAGNTCLGELAVVLQTKFGCELGLRLDRLAELSSLVHRASGTVPPEHKAVTGKWCFTHESGIHVAGVLASQETYQAFPPSLIGRSHEIAFGKHSGAHGVAFLAARHGLELSADECARVVSRIKASGKCDVGPIPEQQVLDWIRAEAAPIRR